MALTVLVVSSLLIVLATRPGGSRPSRRGPAWWWAFSAFGVQLVYLGLTAAKVVAEDNHVIGQLSLAPMIVVGVVVAVRAARTGGSVAMGALLCLAPVVVTSAYILAGYSLLSPAQAILIFLAAVVVPRAGHDREEILDALRCSLRAGAATLLVLAVVRVPTLIGDCRFDKCSSWGGQIGAAGSANALGMSLAFVGVVAVMELPWWRAGVVLGSVYLLVDLCSSRSALFPLALGAAALLGERALRGGSLVSVWRTVTFVVTGTFITLIAVLPWLPNDFTDRGSLWLAARDLIADRPWLGYGVSYWVRLPQTATFYPNYAVHNLLLEMLVSFGVLGTLVLMAGIVATRWSVPTPSIPLWSLTTVCWLAGGVTEVLSAPGRVYLLPAVFVLPFMFAAGPRVEPPPPALAPPVEGMRSTAPTIVVPRLVPLAERRVGDLRPRLLVPLVSTGPRERVRG